MADSTTVPASDDVASHIDYSVPADYRREVDVTRHTEEHVHGNRTQFTQHTTTESDVAGDFDNRLMELVNGAVEAREERENMRANARNRNRLLIMLAVLAMELIVPTLYGWHVLPTLFVKYEVLAITLPDLLLTVYAYLRKY